MRPVFPMFIYETFKRLLVRKIALSVAVAMLVEESFLFILLFLEDLNVKFPITRQVMPLGPK